MPTIIDKIMEKGSLICIQTRFPYLRKSIKPEDIGIKKEDLPENFKIGNKYFIPISMITKLKNIDYLFRTYIASLSFEFPFAHARFVPNSMILKIILKAQIHIDRFYSAVNQIISNYDNYKLLYNNKYLNAAKTTYKRLKQLYNIEKDENSFINEYLEKAIQDFPSKEELKDKYSMRYVIFKISSANLSFINILTEIRYKNTMEQIMLKFIEDGIIKLRLKAHKKLSTLSRLHNLYLSRNYKHRYPSIRQHLAQIKIIDELNYFEDDVIKETKEIMTAILSPGTPREVYVNPVLRRLFQEKVPYLQDKLLNKDTVQKTIEKFIS